MEMAHTNVLREKQIFMLEKLLTCDKLSYKKLLTAIRGIPIPKSYQQSYVQPDKLSVDKFMANNLAIQNIFRIFMGGFF
jgi:hypothetical protein